MLLIGYQDRKSDPHTNISYVGMEEQFSVADVDSVYADGHELQVILEQCKNLCYVPKARTMKWYGDTAKFIVDNVVNNRRLWVFPSSNQSE